MHVVKLELENFRGVGKLEMEFDPHVTVLIGKNGAGKTTIIEGVWGMLVALMSKYSVRPISLKFPDLEIRNRCDFARLHITICPQTNSQEISWEIQVNRGLSGQATLTSVTGPFDNFSSELGDHLKAILEGSKLKSLPVFGYYAVSRSEFELNLKPTSDDETTPPNVEESQGRANFRQFFEWYRIREDLENETRLSSPDKLDYRDQQLEAVRRAFLQMLPNFTELRVRRNPLRLELKKDGESLLIDQLSLGEKSLLAMVGDLAQRLAIRNPALNDPLQGEGVILIDEIDLHLHPHWQRNIIRHLRTVFPNCQFIVSTHSPQIVGEVDPQCLRILSKDSEGNFTVTVPEVSRGLDSAEVLQVIMETPEREEEIDRSLRKIFDDIDHERFDSARSGITELKQTLHGSIPEIVRAETMIALLEP